MMSFSRWMRKNHVENSALATAIREMESGLIDADLGGILFKKRIPLAGMGKRGGARTIVASKREGKWFFLYGFNKNEKANVSQNEKEALLELASKVLGYTDDEIATAISEQELEEVEQ